MSLAETLLFLPMTDSRPLVVGSLIYDKLRNENISLTNDWDYEVKLLEAVSE